MYPARKNRKYETFNWERLCDAKSLRRRLKQAVECPEGQSLSIRHKREQICTEQRDRAVLAAH